MQKLNVVIMGQDCEKHLRMCLKSVRSADNIIYCDGGSEDNSIQLALDYRATVITQHYNQEDKKMNGKQRNFYLKHLKLHHMGEWCLVLDADEVVEDLSKIRGYIDNTTYPEKLVSVKMRHFIGSLGFEDAITPKHHVPHRLFKVREELRYPECEHPVLWITQDGKQLPETELVKNITEFEGTTIWHLAYCSNIWDIRKRYINHRNKSEMHSNEYLDSWYFSHLFGKYPIKEINLMEIPDIIMGEFLINSDKIYYMTHNKLEVKHFLMAKQWKDYCDPFSVLDVGCGLGMYGMGFDNMGVNYVGVEKSHWAVDNTAYKHLDIRQGDITEKQEYTGYDLVLVIDVLEHLKGEDLNKTLNLIRAYGGIFIFSIPYLGDPNLDADPTHRIKESKEWWVNRLSRYFNIKDAPKDWLFHKQMLVGRSK